MGSRGRERKGQRGQREVRRGGNSNLAHNNNSLPLHPSIVGMGAGRGEGGGKEQHLSRAPKIEHEHEERSGREGEGIPKG